MSQIQMTKYINFKSRVPNCSVHWLQGTSFENWSTVVRFPNSLAFGSFKSSLVNCGSGVAWWACFQSKFLAFCVWIFLKIGGPDWLISFWDLVYCVRLWRCMMSLLLMKISRFLQTGRFECCPRTCNGQMSADQIGWLEKCFILYCVERELFVWITYKDFKLWRKRPATP